MVTQSKFDSVSKDVNRRLISEVEAMSQLQLAKFTYFVDPSEFEKAADKVPENISPGWHGQSPEQFT
jgi:hypothetical protein